MAQSELFGSDEMLTITPEDLKRQSEQLSRLGTQAADKITDRIMQSATGIIRNKLDSMGVDVGAAARDAGYDSAEDYISELDTFYEVVSDLCYSYLEGMERAFPFPIIN